METKKKLVIRRKKPVVNKEEDVNKEENINIEPPQQQTKAEDQKEKVIEFNNIKKKDHVGLMELAEELEINDPASFKKHDLINAIMRKYSEKGYQIIAEGILESINDGHGFLRSSELNYSQTHHDVFVAGQRIRKFNLKSGDHIKGIIRPPKDNEKHFSMLSFSYVNGTQIANLRHRVSFEQLTPIYPEKKINFEIGSGSPEDICLRICDLTVPIGFGQRALIIAPPRTGKTVLMQSMAHALKKNHPEVSLIVLLIDERPEEVTDMKRSVHGEVISSTFDEPAHKHIQIAEIALEKAKRMVENGKDVVIFLDSITRLARAYNTVMPSSGKVLTGGIDANAMQGPKQIFGAARNTVEKGSLTIIGTALDKNKSQMDYYILQEFAGTGNCELFLDRTLADRRIYPAIDITQSGTRNEEKFFEASEMNKRWAIRRIVIPMGTVEGMTFLLDRAKKTKSNQELFETMNS